MKATNVIDIDELIENVGTEDVLGFHNARSCSTEIQTEKPWHRAAMYMMAAGQSHKEIAESLGKHVVTVSLLSRQPWFQEQCAKLIGDQGGDEITQILKGAAKDCMFKLIELRDDEKTPKAVVANVCKDLLDRHLGKAPQHLEISSSAPKGDVHEQMEQVEKELQLLRKQESGNKN